MSDSPQHASPQPEAAAPEGHPLQMSGFDPSAATASAGNSVPPPVFQLQDPTGEVAATQDAPQAAPEIPEQLTGSVGNRGANNEADVRVVQHLLIEMGYLPATDADGASNITGQNNTATENAIGTMQAELQGLRDPDKNVGASGTSYRLLRGLPVNTVLQEDSPETEVEGEGEAAAPRSNVAMLERIQNEFPSGVNVAIYAHYANQSANNREFPRAANEYAGIYNSLGFDGAGNLTLGHAFPITNLTGVTTTINDVNKVLVNEWKNSPGYTEGDPEPAWTKIKTLSLFSHGMPYGLHLAENGRYNMRIDSEAEEARFEAFVRGISGALTSDVDVALMACGAARESDGTEPNEIWYKSAADQQDGSSSFAGRLASELGDEASVYGHLSTGHTTNNYSARVFGADAGGAQEDGGGVHIFDAMYPATFVASEAARLEKDEEDVYDWMWAHYRHRMAASHEGNFDIPISTEEGAATSELGSLMFTDIERARTVLQADWQDYGVRTYVQ